MSLRNLELSRLKLSTWRKIALGTWHRPGDPSVYASLQFNATKILERRDRYRQRGERPPTLTAIVAKAAALTLAKYPQLNGLIRWGTIYGRKNVSIFLQTAVDEAGKELSGLTIEKAEDKSIQQIMQEIGNKAAAIRQDRDPNFKQTKHMTRLIPAQIIGRVLGFLAFLLYTLNINLKFLGLPRDPFGSIMITSVGMLGVDEAFAPLVPYSRIPILVVVGEVKDTPIAVEKQVVVAPMYRLSVTFDHRFIDGVYGSKMIKNFQHLTETDEGLDHLGLC